MTAVFNPDRPDFAPYGLTCERWIPQRMRRADRHNEIELNLLSQGSLTYLIGGSKVIVPSGRLTVFWAALPHQIVSATGDSFYYVVTLPLAWFLERNLPQSFVSRILHGQVLAETKTSETQYDWNTFTRWEEDLTQAGTEYQGIILLEAEARLHRLALHCNSKESETSSNYTKPLLTTVHLSKAERMACHIATHYADPLTVADVAAVVRLHPGYAMTVFRKAFGLTIQQFIVQHRMIHAQRALVTSDDRIIDIALSVGFNSLSRFNATFRNLFDCTPREFRRRHVAQIQAPAQV